MKIVRNARRSWRWYSIHALSLQTSALASYAMLPDDMRQAIPTWAVAIGAIAIFLLGWAGRLIDQTPPERSNDAP